MKLLHASSVLLSLGLTCAQENDDTTHGPLWGAYSPPKYPSPWIDGSGDWGDAYQRAQEFVAQLTLMEKVNLTTGIGWQAGKCFGHVGGVPRLGMDGLCLQVSTHGVIQADHASVFPAGGTVAASWDRKLWYQRGYDVGTEHRLKGVDVLLGPVISPLGRSPAGGRNWEAFSPDPSLSGIAAAMTVRGMQDAGVISCPKHYLANEQEHFRTLPEAFQFGYNITNALSANVGDVAMHELYLWPFADAIRAGAGAVMCAHNQVNNSHSCQNSYTLNHLLKGELGFQGFILSDWVAQHSGVSAAVAGLDVSMPGDSYYGTGDSFWGTNMTIAVLNGTLPEWRLDDMATRIMASYYYVGRDTDDVTPNFNSWSKATNGYQFALAGLDYGTINQHIDVREGHAKHIREAAARSTVMLKNNGALPLTGRESNTVVIGEDAEDSSYGPNGCLFRGCNNGTLAIGWGSGTADFPFIISPLTAIQNEVRAYDGYISAITDNYALEAVAREATPAEVAIVFINANSGEGFISVDGNEGDRSNLTLWQGGEELIKTVSSVCNNTIVVMHTVGAVMVDSFYDNPNVTAILWAGLPGEESGNSIADVLYGRINPGGKLPFTIAKSPEDYPTSIIYTPNNGNDAPQQDFDEGVFIDYRAFDRDNIDPIYEFGFGMSYTTFTYSDLTIEKHDVAPYQPRTGMTQPAPLLRNESANPDMEEYLYPDGFRKIPFHIYPYLTSTDLAESYNGSDYGMTPAEFLPEGIADASPQPVLPASGAPGGNPQLWDVLFTVRATITNTGDVDGEEIAQLYISPGGPDDPKVILRNFDRLAIAAGESAVFEGTITRRDLSNWDTAAQDWRISDYPKRVFVGASSRNLLLEGDLEL
ncbi:glycoside hydrolase family 3 protein [Patellaria atrata CBS 101060]|uniref:beta-glucosidase n=1 Tax=Patellaria atrata CBS 101060 TaxID=1346257 RepID=A0A9P4S5Z8_9PEZI|nr:glycoside hydrolase family 3 protein [Patellaria atrata CBS 101060]